MKLNLNEKSLKARLAQAALGLLIGLLVMPPQTPAQWTVHINADTSPTTLAQVEQLGQQTATQTVLLAENKAGFLKQALEYAKEAERWMQKVRQYTETVVREVKRFTTLKGIMSAAEKQLGLSDDTLKALADVGQLIRAAFTLKNQFISLVRTRLAMIESLERRARNGIFDPRADLEDLEDYLQHSIGRSAQATLATRQKLAEKDADLERWTYELGTVRAERAAKQKELEDIKHQLGRESQLSSNTRETGATEEGGSSTVFGERVSLSADAVQAMTIKAALLEQQIQTLVQREQELMDKIAKRYKEHHERFDETFSIARKWRATMDGWNKFSQQKQQEMKRMLDHYGEGESAPNR